MMKTTRLASAACRVAGPPMMLIMRPERIIDANANRAAEGLRALEEVARFLWDDAAQAHRLKQLRHRLRAVIPTAMVLARDTAGDVGVGQGVADEARRSDLRSVVRANAARAQEALRVLEEFAKFLALPAEELATLRYDCYQAERDLLARLPGARLAATRLYALIDVVEGGDPVALASAVARGGAGVVQLRAKTLSPRAYRALAAAVQAVVQAAGALFIVNDHVAVAAVLGADGVHLGQDDLTVADARRVLPAGCLIGVSAHNPDQVLAAQQAGADYLGLGPIYGTPTKPHEPVQGPALLDAVAGILTVPSFAIGGLDLERTRALQSRIPHGVAVAGDLARAADPQAQAAAYRQLWHAT